MDVPAYLERIGYTGLLEPTAETLFALHRAHLLSVPFENLDIHLGREIHLGEATLFDKIVTRRRGGFCFELNGLFARLLEEIGFSVDRLAAASAEDDGTYKADFEHLALRVTAPASPDEHWLADVGWGNGPCEPLRIATDEIQRQGDRRFRIRSEGEFRVLAEDYAEKGERARWVKHYRFSLQPHPLTAFEAMCRHLQTSPESIFVKKRMCTVFTSVGRITVSDLRLIDTANGERSERDLSGEEEWRQVLKERFGVEL